ncbi:XdhC family protein [Frigidibacter sp. MR17.24]|uniref:XdhC family protein n=1 Tax=Frigidibacter sp. MR17.24 TaxID=3127345 RepID=UPI003012A182
MPDTLIPPSSSAAPDAAALDRARSESIPEIALDWLRAGKGVALASVVETWGSAPRGTGSQLAVSSEAEMMGSVSGGCVEGAVIEESLAAIADGQARLLEFGVSDDDAFAVGLACGGRIRVLVQPVTETPGQLTPALLGALVAARADRTPVALVTALDGFATRLVARAEASAAVAARFRADRSGVEGAAVEGGVGEFVGLHNPPLRMVVVGAVHIAQALLPMARLAGYDPVLVDPRGAFGSETRFPGERILDDWPDEALAAIGPDARTAVITLTHDPKLDDPAIRATLASEAFYLGCLGSPRTHAKRLARLEAEGVAPAEIARIHAPVGLDIGAKSPGEIAVSIMAQVTQVLRRG